MKENITPIHNILIQNQLKMITIGETLIFLMFNLFNLFFYVIVYLYLFVFMDVFNYI